MCNRDDNSSPPRELGGVCELVNGHRALVSWYFWRLYNKFIHKITLWNYCRWMHSTTDADFDAGVMIETHSTFSLILSSATPGCRQRGLWRSSSFIRSAWTRKVWVKSLRTCNFRSSVFGRLISALHPLQQKGKPLCFNLTRLNLAYVEQVTQQTNWNNRLWYMVNMIMIYNSSLKIFMYLRWDASETPPRINCKLS